MSIFLLLATFSHAETIHINSIATPEGVSLQKYNELSLLLNQKIEGPVKRNAETEADFKQKTESPFKLDAEKAESRKIASSAKRDFENKVKNAWQMPANASGQKTKARVTLTDRGLVSSIIVHTSNPDLKRNVEHAIRSAAPYAMPSDPDARRQARIFNITFIAK